MNFDRSLIFSYLEEDNIQRAYFRVRPLLTLEGDVREKSLQLWPNEGGLRIVPDRNEQHTFKVRMRTLGSYCVVDLRNQPPEAGKIRTNKNYRPDKGEVNQYILYSDTVHALPEHTFYQLIDGTTADYTAAAAQAVTPLFFIRENDALYGPVSKASPSMPETAKEASGMLFELPCPDGATRLMLCIDNGPAAEKIAEETPAAEAAETEPVRDTSAAEATSASQAEDATAETNDVLPIGETLQILDQKQSHEETLKELDKPVSSDANLLRQPEQKPLNLVTVQSKHEPLSGTPLVRTPLHMAVQQPKNKIQEVVSTQWSIGKYEPPAQNLPHGTAMREIHNPVEVACSRLREAWNAADAHEKLADYILSLDGARSKFEAKLCNGKTLTILQRVLRERLQDLEAERLTALCELDRARRDVDAYKQELINGLATRIQRETGSLEIAKQEAEAHVAVLKAEINGLTLQRDGLLTKVNELQNNALPEAVAKLTADAHLFAPVNGIPLRISPISGEKVPIETLIERLMDICAKSGVRTTRNDAIAALVLLALSPRVGLSSPTPAPVATLLKNIASAMGWQSSFAHQISAEQTPLVGLRPVDHTPALLVTSLPNYAPISGISKLTLNRSTASLIRNAAYDASQWPVLMLPALPYVPDVEVADAAPVSQSSLDDILLLSKAPQDDIDAVLSPILKAALPLSGTARQELCRFVSICAGLMDGGLPAAADWGILLWIVPALERGSKQYAAVKMLLDEYPLSLSKM